MLIAIFLDLINPNFMNNLIIIFDALLEASCLVTYSALHFRPVSGNKCLSKCVIKWFTVWFSEDSFRKHLNRLFTQRHSG